MLTELGSHTTPTRRNALLTALGGSLAALGGRSVAAKKGKNKKRKKKRCPNACPARVACSCQDGSCDYFPVVEPDPFLQCNEYCASRGGSASHVGSAPEIGVTVICTQSNGAFAVDCPLA